MIRMSGVCVADLDGLERAERDIGDELSRGGSADPDEILVLGGVLRGELASVQVLSSEKQTSIRIRVR